MAEKNAYILGTEREELYRLGYQHQVWSKEARKGWEIGEFSYGQTILDLGCGPGFCTQELAYIAGPHGKVIGVDKSRSYIDFLDKTNELHALNIETHCCDFNEMSLSNESLDAIYCRWAMAWISNPEEIINKTCGYLKSGGAFVIQEYYDWSTFQIEPNLPGMTKAIKAALKSMKEQDGDIDIGRRLPAIFYDAGMEVISTRLMPKLATPEDLNWYWPKTFLHIYLPKIVERGFLSQGEVEEALDDFEQLEFINGATIHCPQMIEVVAVKP
ncbi:MAG: methyltransferase domain-containing protein [Bacteroidia bacterium]|nr:methyltransferase domain-containing protein [Bacteroidia bacterium]